MSKISEVLQEFYDIGYKKGYEDAKKEFERPKGEWKYDGFCVTTTQYKCNKCEYSTLEKTNFCPNCGARMKGGAEE